MKGALKIYGPALISGAVLALSFPTFRLFPLAWFGLAPLFFRTASLTPRRAALHFFLAGWVFHSVLLQWLTANIMWAGGWALFGYQLLCLVLALFWAVYGFVWRWLGRTATILHGATAAAVLWMAMEHLQGNLFSGFGWSSLGYSQGADLILLQVASIGGGILISGIVVFVNACVGLAAAEKLLRVPRTVGAVALLVAAHAAGYFLLTEPEYGEEPFQVGIFQSNFPLEMKWDREYTQEMVRNAATKSRLLDAHNEVDLFVWPEALIMGDIDNTAIADRLRVLTGATNAPLFTGSARYEDDRSYNAGYYVTPGGRLTDYYDKMRLAPFGEYVPLSQWLPFVDKLVPTIGNLAAGSEYHVFAVDDRAFGPLICFEVIFPQMSETLRSEGADFLVVITNLAWFGRSNAIPQELEIARMRAVETGLPLVHAANTGISGVFDPYGRLELTSGYVRGQGSLYHASLSPSMSIMQRLIDAHPLPLPADRPLSVGPTLLPKTATVLSGLLILIAGLIAYARKNHGRRTRD